MIYAIILAAGKGSRAALKINKVLFAFEKKSILGYSIESFVDQVDGIVVVHQPKEKQAILEELKEHQLLEKISLFVQGGETRQESVYNALKQLPQKVEKVLIHDGARPFVSKKLIKNIVSSLKIYQGVVPALPLKDTIKKIDEKGYVDKTLFREELIAAQTPQGFNKNLLIKAYQKGEKEGFIATDDASLVENLGEKVFTVEGEETNIKITTPQDFDIAWSILNKTKNFIANRHTGPKVRIGQGYDVHRLVENRKLILLGVEVPHTKGLLGHSDADVGTHALIDALLGAAALGDIGTLFPDNQEKFKNISSLLLLEEVVEIIHQKGYEIGNIDITFIAQAPKLAPYKTAMAEKIQKVLNISLEDINIKATTTENLGFEGEGKGITAQAVAILYKNQ